MSLGALTTLAAVRDERPPTKQDVGKSISPGKAPEAAALGCAVGAASTQAAGGTGSAPDLAAALARAGTATIIREPEAKRR